MSFFYTVVSESNDHFFWLCVLSWFSSRAHGKHGYLSHIIFCIILFLNMYYFLVEIDNLVIFRMCFWFPSPSYSDQCEIIVSLSLIHHCSYFIVHYIITCVWLQTKLWLNLYLINLVYLMMYVVIFFPL